MSWKEQNNFFKVMTIVVILYFSVRFGLWLADYVVG